VNELFEGMFEQAGIVTAETSEQFIDLVTAFTSLPVPRGGRVAVVTVGGGWGVVAADASDREGVKLATMSDSVIAELDTFLPKYWSHGNPVDLVGGLRRSSHFRAIDVVTRSKDVDMVIIMGAMLGREFFTNNIFHTAVRPLYQMLTKNPRQLPAFIGSFWKGFSKSVSDRKVENLEGSVGLNPAEAWEWTDYALIRHLKGLISETGKPIIAVAMSEQQKGTSTRLESHGIRRREGRPVWRLRCPESGLDALPPEELSILVSPNTGSTGGIAMVGREVYGHWTKRRTSCRTSPLKVLPSASSRSARWPSR
jgi:hypothetical protein